MLLETLVILAVALAALSCWLSHGAWTAARRPAPPPEGVLERLALVHAATDAHPRALREEAEALRAAHSREAAQLRDEVAKLVRSFQAVLTDGQKSASETVERSTKNFGDFQRERLDKLEKAQGEGLAAVALQLDSLRKDGEARQEKMRETLTAQLDALRRENEAKLEQMRLTVDEKLQGTLEQRLGESFKQVSEQLATVHSGLGEMNKLAADVGGLQRVLTNVKSRGGWGEVQLSRLIEDRFTPEQYQRNFRPQPGSAEVVEFAVRLPGRDGDGCCIPIDSKFPTEAYDRLLAAQERGDAAEADRAGRALDAVIRAEALRICKYLNPPHTTDFAIMFLPTEGLFAEVIRRPGLVDELQRDRRVTVTGPTTLSAFLTSLDLGFRTQRIEKRASEVWQVLGAAKAEFNKYGAVWEKLEKQLDTAKNTVAEAGRRTRAVERRLREVETADAAPDAPAGLLALPAADEDEAA